MTIKNTFPGNSTLERLQERFSGSYEAAIPYGDHVIAAAYAWDYDARDMVCVCAVYAYHTKDRGIEAPIVFVKQSETSFSDVGHALEWGIDLAKSLDSIDKCFRRAAQ